MKIDEKTSVKPFPSDERITWFEQSYKIKLPHPYIDFLKRFNGATPITNVLKIDRQEYVIERFLCLLDNPKEHPIEGWYDLTSVLTQLDGRLIDDEELIGMNIIPIAAMFAGDFICLDFRNSENPKIVIWDHEESEELEPATTVIANSFEEFLTMLS
ncbi:SMI1 / KNR4 family (SUKH-1) [Bacillus sp. 491mf]|uniref:SMI1/KNR4 family protein n=1 Tax=Bacillus sp. 491mf TaxID=1761755 RepID=UPI0008F39610|nr:SMI1/KNR4 family protein [Bacillus sp. 491mf]SFD60309.1 SMI1 / KNR4 family (SUKH-1) [Bacillus sp. 491mf]